MRLLDKDDEKDEDQVTWEDQQRINSFSKLNTRIRRLQEQMITLKEEKEALEDLSTELELADEDESVIYKIGESFVHLSHAKAMKRLQSDQEEIDSQVSNLSSAADECDRDMKELKVQLYAKFGKSINLDE